MDVLSLFWNTVDTSSEKLLNLFSKSNTRSKCLVAVSCCPVISTVKRSAKLIRIIAIIPSMLTWPLKGTLFPPKPSRNAEGRALVRGLVRGRGSAPRPQGIVLLYFVVVAERGYDRNCLVVPLPCGVVVGLSYVNVHVGGGAPNCYRDLHVHVVVFSEGRVGHGAQGIGVR